jgi:SAM-dependent methyltransferase
MEGDIQMKGETDKAKVRREREDFFNKYCQGKGIDIGCGKDILTAPNVQGWDKSDGDAQTMAGVGDNEYDYVYSSHCLEHVEDAKIALRNWWRILKPGGYLILLLPHRDLYEKKKELPSRYNHTHLRFFIVERDELPCTMGVIPLLNEILGNGFTIKYIKECDEGHTITNPLEHSDGEYSIEMVVKK